MSMGSIFKSEAWPGILLLIASFFSIVVSNSALAPWYGALLSYPVGFHTVHGGFSLPLLAWVNEGLMSLFFFLIALEIKVYFLEGKKNASSSHWTLPLGGAVGGMVMPALIFMAINMQHPVFMTGWAIPTSTDIAFSLGFFSILGLRVPIALKIFLMSLCIIDDIGAILIITFYYAVELSLPFLCMTALWTGLIFRVKHWQWAATPVVYIAMALVLWFGLMHAGVHPTLSGVIMAAALPMDRLCFNTLIHRLAPVVSCGIIPLFAFMNLGISLDTVTWQHLYHPVAMGVALGLFFGKPLGIFGAAWLMVRFGVSQLPERVGWAQLFGASILGGVGFTMSLFITTLSYAAGSFPEIAAWMGIVIGSIAAMVTGLLWLSAVLPAAASDAE